jgi:hypothetical protein
MECRFQPAGDPVELRLRNDTDIDPYIMATNADIPEFDAYSQAASMKERARWTPRILAKLTAAVPGASAITNAVCHATGKRVRDLPVIAEKLRYAIPYDGTQNTYGHDQRGETHASIRAI